MNDFLPNKASSELIPSACAVAVTDHGAGPRALLVHRSPELSFQGDLWAFPGGHVDAADQVLDDDLETAQRCAVRETREETGLALGAEDLIYMARWITPVYLPRRFDTWFFLTTGDFGSVTVDGHEIIDHQWIPPRQALLDHNQNKRRLTPPAFVILSRLAGLDSVPAILENVQDNGVPYFKGQPVELPNGLCALYEGDVAYGHSDLTRPGPRHRLWLRSSGWQYENNL